MNEKLSETLDQSLFEHICALEMQLHSSAVRSNEQKISELLSTSFYEFGSSGKIWSRADILSRLPAEDGNTKIEAFNFKARLLSEEAVLITYLSKHTDVNQVVTECNRSSIWKINGTQWQMEFHQGTRTSRSQTK